MSFDFGSNFWDNRYGAGDDYVFGTAPNDFLAACTPHIPAGPVLCLAEGEGRNSVHLARHGHAVTAVDQSAVGLSKTERLAASHKVTVTTHLADLADYPIAPGTWSAIVSIFCHLPPGLRQEVHARAAAGLVMGGVIVLEAYSPDKEFPGIKWDVAKSIKRPVIEGSGHTGPAAVTQLFGRRIA